MALSVNEITEAFLESMKVIVDGAEKNRQQDITEKALIVDASNHQYGRYTVYNGSAKYVATCTNTNLIEGMQVLVAIPKGDFSGIKTIVDRCISDTIDGELLDSPFSRCELSNQNLVGNITDEIVLIPHYLEPEEKELIINLTDFYLDSAIQNNKYIGISADFRAALKDFYFKDGDYGIKVEITYKPEETDSYTKTYRLSAKTEMIGDIYNFNTFFPQAALYVLDEKTRITDIKAYLYQNGDFISTNPDISEEEILNGRIYVQNISIRFGQDKSATSELDRASLICANGIYYNAAATATENQKIINLKWQFKNKKNSTYSEIKNITDFKEATGLDAYKIYWFRKSPKIVSDYLNEFDQKSKNFEQIQNEVLKYYVFYKKYRDKMLTGSSLPEKSFLELVKTFNNYYLELAPFLGESAFSLKTLPLNLEGENESAGSPYMMLTLSGENIITSTYGSISLNDGETSALLEDKWNDYVNKKSNPWTSAERKKLEEILILAGDNWEYLDSVTDKFTLNNFNPDITVSRDELKVIIEYGLLDKNEVLNKTNSLYKTIETNILSLENINSVYFDEKEKNFTLLPKDNSGGVYYNYRADNFSLSDIGDANKERELEITFSNSEANSLALNDILIWRLPKDNNSMLKFNKIIDAQSRNIIDQEGKPNGLILQNINELNNILTETQVKKNQTLITPSYFLDNKDFNDYIFVERRFLFDENRELTGAIGCSYQDTYTEEGNKIQEEIEVLNREQNKELKQLEDLQKAKPDGENYFLGEPVWGNVSPITNGEWVKTNGKWKFKQDGKFLTYWQYIRWGGKNYWFYFNSEGIMATGWKKNSKNEWFYLNADGTMVTGWQYLDYKGVKDWYFFDYVSGKMAVNKDIKSNLTFGKDGSLSKVTTLTIEQQRKDSQDKINQLESAIARKQEEKKKYLTTTDEDRLKAFGVQKYYINSFYSNNYTDNEIKCYIIRENSIIESSLNFYFGQQGLQTGDYNFIIRFGAVVDENFNVVKDIGDPALITRANDNQNTNDYQEIIFEIHGPDGKQINLTNDEKNHIINLWQSGNSDGYFSGHDKYDKLDFKVNQDEGRVAIRLKKGVTIENCSNIVLKAKYNELTQLFPLHIKKAYTVGGKTYNQQYLVGSEFIIYNQSGSNPKYNTDDYKLINGSNSTEISGRFKVMEEPMKKVISFDEATGKKMKPVNTFYDSNITSVSVGFYRGENQTLIYSFPICMLKNRYQIVLIDDRVFPESTPISDNQSIVSSVLTSSNSNSNSNSAFTGVVLGNIQNTNSSPSTGLFGFIDGSLSYGFYDSGEARIGRESKLSANGSVINNGGWIHFNESGGRIESGDKENGTIIDLTKGSFQQAGPFSLVGCIPDELKANASGDDAGSRILFRQGNAYVDTGLWYKNNVIYPFFELRDIISNNECSLTFNKDDFYIKAPAFKIDIKNNLIDFYNKFKVDTTGVYCNKIAIGQTTLDENQLKKLLNLISTN